MIHVTPRKVVSAGHIVEFIAEVPVAIVKVKMHQKVREREKEHDGHAIREEGLFLIGGYLRLISSGIHFCVCGGARVGIPNSRFWPFTAA